LVQLSEFLGLSESGFTNGCNRGESKCVIRSCCFRDEAPEIFIRPQQETVMMFTRRTFAAISAVSLMAVPIVARAGDTGADRKLVERGRYVVKIGGCNDCHTPGYALTDGKVPEKDWLIGDQLGWRGPWGTTYPPNLRLALKKMSENEWVKIAHNASFRPPMPSVSLRNMSERDLRAVYRFVLSLGPGGSEAPAYVPPDQQPIGPVVMFPAPPN
jgi:mono/diheme cytochrome c family protein